jgi:hypothetical protein
MNTVLDTAKKTYFINPQYTNRVVCWIGHCDKMRYKQRHERARIFKVFANETVAAIERILHHYWLVDLEAEAAKIDHIVQDIYCADCLYYERICVEDLGHEDEFASVY